MSRKDNPPHKIYPGFSTQDGVLERRILIEDSGENENCMLCSEEYDSVACCARRCPSYDGDLEALAETLARARDTLKRGVPLEVPPQ